MRLKQADFDRLNKVLLIKGRWIWIDDVLVDDLAKLIDLRVVNSNMLLSLYNGSKVSDKITGTAEFLKRTILRGDTNGLITYALRRMIKEELPFDFIKSITAVGDKKLGTALNQKGITNEELLERYNRIAISHYYKSITEE